MMDDDFLDKYSDDFGGLSDVSAEEAQPIAKRKSSNIISKPQKIESDGFESQALVSLDSPPTLTKKQ